MSDKRYFCASHLIALTPDAKPKWDVTEFGSQLVANQLAMLMARNKGQCDSAVSGYVKDDGTIQFDIIRPNGPMMASTTAELVFVGLADLRTALSDKFPIVTLPPEHPQQPTTAKAVKVK